MSEHRPPEGTHVTYAEDPVFPGDWFADLRDDVNGRVIETGSGTTREAARARLLERYYAHWAVPAEDNFKEVREFDAITRDDYPEQDGQVTS